MALDIPRSKEIFRQRDVRETEPRFTAGEGIDISTDKVISGEDATTTNKGIASFNTNDFSVSSGAVSLKNKTSYYSISGIKFKPKEPDVNDHGYDGDEGRFYSDDAISGAMASVELPHGAVVTSCIVQGGDSAETWILGRADNAADNFVTMASGNWNTADTSITSATIDNQNYRYWISTSTIDAADNIYGATIAYTTDYD